MSNPWLITTSDVHADDWPDAAALDTATVQRRLDAAQVACQEFAPVLDLAEYTGPDDLPPGWLTAVIYRARDIQAAASRATGDTLLAGPAEFPIRIYPLSSEVKALLRPPTFRPAVG